MNRNITVYGLIFLALMVGFAISLLWAVGVGKGLWVAIGCGMAMLALPACLSVRAAWRSGEWRYLFQFMFLYLALGVARGVASVKIR